MNESEMGYRGSKSNALAFVKEQRVDGSWPIISNMKHIMKDVGLRYTLMAGESQYPVGIPSKNYAKMFYSTSGKLTLHPYFITGFTDAEGSFIITIYPDSRMRNGVRVEAMFKIGLNERDKDLLIQIQQYFGGIGHIYHEDSVKGEYYKVSKKLDLLNVIIPHFEKYPLLTQKQADFKLFVQIVQLMNKNAHLDKDGLQEIVNIRASLNTGASKFIQSYFPSIQAVTKETVYTSSIPSSY